MVAQEDNIGSSASILLTLSCVFFLVKKHLVNGTIILPGSVVYMTKHCD